MSNLFGSIILSDWFLFFILLGIFFAITRWAVKVEAFTGYALGWLLGLLFIVIFGSLAGDANLSGGGNGELNLLQVLFALALGIFTGLGSVFIPGLVPKSQLRTGLQAVFMTSISVSLLFLMLVASTEIRRMIGILSLTAGIIILSVYMLTRYYRNRVKQAAEGTLPVQEAPPSDDLKTQVQTASNEPDTTVRFRIPDAIKRRHSGNSSPDYRPSRSSTWRRR